MRMTGIGLIAAAALAGSVGIAVAQTSTTTSAEAARRAAVRNPAFRPGRSAGMDSGFAGFARAPE